jgi:hypothetical protein
MDLDGYEECLDEDFLFRFPDEIADSLGLPPEAPWWGKTDEITCTLNMFEDPAVQSIGFGCELLEEWVAYQEVRPDTTFTGLFRRLRPVIVVTVATDGSEDPLLSYVVNQSWLDVVVVPDRYTEGLWCVLRIDEVKMPYLRAHPAVIGSAVESATWGGIKSMWAEE